MTDTITLDTIQLSAKKSVLNGGKSTPFSAPPEPEAELAMDKLIQVILSTKRCHSSKGELNFVAWLYKALEAMGHKGEPMAEGAITVQVGKGSKTLFSCHVDTVHSSAESDGSLQELFYDPSFGHIFLGDKTKSTCLGADDGAGIYIMLKMIEANVTGTYIFHRGEEKGGISAYAMSKKHEPWLKKFDACIAFDRPGDHEVICTQGGQVCASVGFGTQLASALNEHGLKYEVSHRGVFTDSKVYRQIIPECINLGVGYYSQHGTSEYLDWNHVTAMTKAAIALDWSALKVQRVIQPDPPPAQYKFHDDAEYYSDRADAWRSSNKSQPALKAVEPVLADELDIDFENMSRAEIDDYTADEVLTNAIMRLVVELDAERGRVTRLQMLLGM
jgi:hypothetical protein